MNCSQVHLMKPQSQGFNSGGIPGTIRQGFAIRGVSCLACHGYIKGPLYTDFGYGDPFFFGKNTWGQSYYKPENLDNLIIEGDIYVPHRTIPNNNIASYYINDYNSRSGKPSTQYVKLSEYFNLRNPKIPSVTFKADGTPSVFGGHVGSIYERDLITISAPQEQELIDIIAKPTTQLINKYDDVAYYRMSDRDSIDGILLKANDNTYEVYARNDNIHTGGVITCVGDFIINGSLFLKDATIKTGTSGCRIYTTGTIFIQGPINYIGYSPDSQPNLQLSSARGILIGFKSLNQRFQDSAQNGIHNFQSLSDEQFLNQKIASDRDRIDLDFTEDAGPYRVAYSGYFSWNENYYQDGSPYFYDWSFHFVPALPPSGDKSANFIGFKLSDDDDGSWIFNPNLTIPPRPYACPRCMPPDYDPRNFNTGKSPKITSPDNGKEDWAMNMTFPQPWASALKRRVVNYDHLVLNAPKIWNRYHGTFKGMIIAEQLLGPGQDPQSNGQYSSWIYDPLFATVPILPLFGSKLFSVTDE